MKFLSIELEHVFAYDKRAIIDLSGTTEGPEHRPDLGPQRDGEDKLPQCPEAALYRR